MSEFIEKGTQPSGYELCGRIIREGDSLVVFIDGLGRFPIPSGVVTATLLGLGEGAVSGPIPGVVRISESGRGFYLETSGERYVTPVSRVRAVMEGRNRKGPISKMI